MANNNFNFGMDTDSGPSRSCFAVTPHDSSNFTQGEVRGLYIGSTGNVVVVRPDGTAVTFVGVPTGMILPVRAIRVNSTSTTATSIVGLL